MLGFGGDRERHMNRRSSIRESNSRPRIFQSRQLARTHHNARAFRDKNAGKRLAYSHRGSGYDYNLVAASHCFRLYLLLIARSKQFRHLDPVVSKAIPQAARSANPAGRSAEVEDIAPAAVFFGSTDSAWITGETLRIAGGLR
jgi:hypothetical protein